MGFMQKSSNNLLRTAVLIAQAMLVVAYAGFFSLVPAVLDNPGDHRGNPVFWIPTIALAISILGFFFARIAAILMMAYTITIYVALVIVDQGHWSSFAYALGPAWPPLIAAGGLSWAAKRQSTVGSVQKNGKT
jgi:hypothetical protein